MILNRRIAQSHAPIFNAINCVIEQPRNAEAFGGVAFKVTESLESRQVLEIGIVVACHSHLYN